MKKLLTSFSSILFGLSLFVTPVYADSVTVDFENPPYSVGNINGQDGWMKTGAFDVAVVSNTYGYSSFGLQSLRTSDAVTSGSFGDQTFAKPLVNAVGEVDSTDSTYSRGTLQNHLEVQFDLASTIATYQPGMHVSVSPDRGDGSRMSYLRFEDQSDGIHVFFDDVADAGPIGTVANFVETDVATITRVPHTVKLSMDLFDGPGNDVVKVWVDGTLVKTGTSWENYYRYDPEAVAEQSPRIVKTVLFRESGTANVLDSGTGFLIDNLSINSVIPVLPSVPVILSPASGASVTTTALDKIDWTDSSGTFAPFEYQYQAFADAAYTSLIYSSGWLTASEIPTPGTPPGNYYVQVRAKDAEGNMSDWSNDIVTPYLITVIPDTTPTPTESPTITPTPTVPPQVLSDKTQCMNSGWMAFLNFLFKNQGDCVSYVQSSPNAIGNKTK